MPPLLQVALLSRLATSFPDAVAWKNLADGSELGLVEWHTRANQLARGLQAHGVNPGSRVALAIGNHDPFTWLISYMGIHRAGGVAVPLNTRLAGPELERIMAHAEPVITLTSGAVLAGAPQLATSAPLVVSTDPEGELLPWSALLDPDPSDNEHHVRGDDIADLMYTSGTTGSPKGVAIRHGGLSSVDRVPDSWLGLGFLTASPFSTTSGSLLVCGPMRGGLTGFFLPAFDPARWLHAVSTEAPVVAFLVPAMVQLIVAHPDAGAADLSSLAVVNIGSAPIATATLQRFGQLLGRAEVLCGYGMTEFGAVTALPLGDKNAHLGSVGLPLPGVEVRVVDDTGAEVPGGQNGEIVVRGKRPSRTYFNDPTGAAATWRDGWLQSGDLGHLDRDGFLWIAGRKKEMIIRGGHNIMPGEIEAVLFSHPLIREAAVAGVPHDVLGEDVAAWVVPTAEVTVDALRAFLLERLADYKVPRRITLIDALPRNDAGKVVTSQLVASFEPRSTP